MRPDRGIYTSETVLTASTAPNGSSRAICEPGGLQLDKHDIPEFVLRKVRNAHSRRRAVILDAYPLVVFRVQKVDRVFHGNRCV